MNTDILSQFGLSFWSLAKWFYVVLYLLYFGFAVVVGRQMQLMHKTLGGTGVVSLRYLGIGLVVVSGLAMLLALVIL